MEVESASSTSEEKTPRPPRFVEAVLDLVLNLVVAVTIAGAVLVFVLKTLAHLLEDLVRLPIAVLRWLFENRGTIAKAVLVAVIVLLVLAWKALAKSLCVLDRFSRSTFRWSWRHRKLVAGMLLLTSAIVLACLLSGLWNRG